MTIGANVAPVYADHVRELLDHADTRRGIVADIKEFKKELKEKGAPVAALLRVQKESIKEPTQEETEDDRKARAILGIPTMRKDRVPSATGIDPELIKLVRQRLGDIGGLEDQKDEITAAEKEIYEAIKEMGLSVKITKKMIVFLTDPDKKSVFDEDNQMIETYLASVKDRLPD